MSEAAIEVIQKLEPPRTREEIAEAIRAVIAADTNSTKRYFYSDSLADGSHVYGQQSRDPSACHVVRPSRASGFESGVTYDAVRVTHEVHGKIWMVEFTPEQIKDKATILAASLASHLNR